MVVKVLTGLSGLTANDAAYSGRLWQHAAVVRGRGALVAGSNAGQVSSWSFWSACVLRSTTMSNKKNRSSEKVSLAKK